MTNGWSLAALSIVASAGVARALFAIWGSRRWLDSVDHLAEVVQPGQRITSRSADGAIIEITSDMGTETRAGTAGMDSGGCPIAEPSVESGARTTEPRCETARTSE
jgi:hypothetical protein